MKKIITGAILAAAPVMVMAQTTIFSLLGVVKNVLNILIPLLITAALAYFIYGIIKYVVAADADDKAKARDIVVRGILGLFVIVSVWGLIGVIQSTFGIGSGGDVSVESGTIPTVGF
jgi:hypothetical protein